MKKTENVDINAKKASNMYLYSENPVDIGQKIAPKHLSLLLEDHLTC